MPLVEPVDTLLTMDVGNTRLGLGVWDGDGLHDAHRAPLREPERCRAALAEAWRAMNGRSRAVVMASVASAEDTARMRALTEDVCGKAACRVRDDIPLPMRLDVENVRDVGVDRVCNAAAAFERVQRACVVASFGTAITIDCVSEDGRFLGGAILPGLQASCDALHTFTANLPRVTPRAPACIFGRNTYDAIVNGVVWGAVGALREIVERYATELREWPQLIITGGDAPLLAELADYVDGCVPDLCLMGIALAYRKAAGEP